MLRRLTYAARSGKPNFKNHQKSCTTWDGVFNPVNNGIYDIYHIQLVGNEISEASTIWFKYLELACHIFAVVFSAKRCLYTYIHVHCI